MNNKHSLYIGTRFITMPMMIFANVILITQTDWHWFVKGILFLWALYVIKKMIYFDFQEFDKAYNEMENKSN